MPRSSAALRQIGEAVAALFIRGAGLPIEALISHSFIFLKYISFIYAAPSWGVVEFIKKYTFESAI